MVCNGLAIGCHGSGPVTQRRLQRAPASNRRLSATQHRAMTSPPLARMMMKTVRTRRKRRP
jgi:hypothetical protein